jgi:hypothetical protein
LGDLVARERAVVTRGVERARYGEELVDGRWGLWLLVLSPGLELGLELWMALRVLRVLQV